MVLVTSPKCYSPSKQQELFTNQQNIICQKTWISCRTPTSTLHTVITKWEVYSHLCLLHWNSSLPFLSYQRLQWPYFRVLRWCSDHWKWWLPHNSDKPLLITSDCPVTGLLPLWSKSLPYLAYLREMNTKIYFPFSCHVLVYINFLNLLM